MAFLPLCRAVWRRGTVTKPILTCRTTHVRCHTGKAASLGSRLVRIQGWMLGGRQADQETDRWVDREAGREARKFRR